MEDLRLIGDPSVLAVPVAENGDPLVDAAGMFQLDDLKNDGSGLHSLLRTGVVERLSAAALPHGLTVRVIEGFRPLSLQRRYFDDYVRELQNANPMWSDDRLRAEASKYVAPPDILPPHSTGGAVDLTLADSAGVPLDMGTRVNADPVESDGACFTAATNISAAARANRRLLCVALEQVGLVNYPTEWWHWSWGDRYWAYHAGAPHAVYGPAR